MKRENWRNEKVYNHLGKEVKLWNYFYESSRDHWSGLVSSESYLNLESYGHFTLSERLVMCKISMIYNGKRSLEDNDLSYLTGYKDKLDVSEVRNCRSWKSLCNKVQYIMLGHTEPINEKSVLLNLIAKLIHREFTEYDMGGYGDSRYDLILALRLYHISGYDRDDLYSAISKIELPYNSDNIKDSLICTLKLLKVWKDSYLYQVMYETMRILMVKNMKQSLILKTNDDVQD